MPWYRVFAHHGSGHQSHTQEYVWDDRKLDPAEHQVLFENICQSLGLSNPIGGVQLLRKLPKDVWERKMAGFVRRIKGLREMQAILRKTPQGRPLPKDWWRTPAQRKKAKTVHRRVLDALANERELRLRRKR